MKKILLSAMVLATMGTFAQVKVGTNPTTLATDANFQVEGTTTAEQFVVLKNGNVGIGTTTPSTKLSVLRGANGEVGPVITASAPVFSLVREGTGGTKWPLNATFDLGTYATGVNSQSQLDIKLANGGVATPDVTVMSLQGNGNVGIGTTSPVAKLEVNSFGGNVIYANQVHSLGLGSGIVSVTNIDLNGGNDFNGGLFKAILDADNNSASAGGAYFIGMQDAETVSGGGIIDFQVFGGGGAFFRGGVAAQSIALTNTITVGDLPAGAATDAVVVADANGLLKKVSASTIGNDGDAWGVTGEDTTSSIGRTGNVGIGTTTPVARLDVVSEALFRGGSVSTDFTSASDQILFGFNGKNEFKQAIRTRHDDGVNNNINAIEFVLYNASTDGINDSPSTYAMTLVNTPSGAANVGIGTTAPNAQLQLSNTIVNRKIVLFEGANNDHEYYGLGINDNMFRYQVGGTAASHAFFTGSSATTSNELMRIQGNGNVGIGTTAPTQKLTIAGTGAALGVDNQTVFQAKNAAGVYEDFLFPRWADDVMYLNYGANGFNIRNNSDVPTMFMTNSGNVGIGTTTPSSPLEVVTGANYIRATTNDGNGSGGGFGYAFRIANINEDIARINGVYENSAFNGFGGMSFTTRNAGGTLFERMRINAAGNVGIGTTSPVHKLGIVGLSGAFAGARTDGIFSISDGTGVDGDTFMQMGVVTDSFGWLQTGDPGVSIRSFVINPVGGNVGIGTTTPGAKLEVNGFIKVGSSDTATPSAGMIKFNAATSKFQGFDGTAWVDLH